MLVNENLKEYSDPLLYDLENPDFEPEGLFYILAQLRRKTYNSIVDELGHI